MKKITSIIYRKNQNKRRYTMTKLVFKKTPDDALATMPLRDKQKLATIITSIEGKLCNIKRDIFEIGRLLYNAKKILPHGKYEEWIEIHFARELPRSTASLYVKIFETFEKSPKTVLYLPVTFLLKMTQTSFPEEIFKIISENVNSDKLDVRAIDEAYTLFKKGDIDLSKFELIAKRQIELAIDMEWGKTERRNSKEMAETVHGGFKSLEANVNKLQMMTNRLFYFIYPDHKEGIIKDIDKAISKLNDLKESIINTKGFFKLSENKITGRKELV
jgi:Protein of unknown function (DUF3102)